jgi:hypothetical protein
MEAAARALVHSCTRDAGALKHLAAACSTRRMNFLAGLVLKYACALIVTVFIQVSKAE